MSAGMRRPLRNLACGCAILACGGLGYAAADLAASVPVKQVRAVKVSARRFVFTPAELTVKKGEPVDIELRSDDVLMGFSVPDFSARADLPPGQVVHLRFTPTKTGRFTFLCDVFCGSGHEDMSGILTVTD